MTVVPERLLDPVTRILEAMQAEAPGIDPDRVMLVGAWCRDALHALSGHAFPTTATRDVDLALAVSSWPIYERLAAAFPRVSDSGIAFMIEGTVVDLLPFGALEDPRGSIVPPTRGEAISVWAFEEVFRTASSLALGPSLTIRCPTVPGYTATKLAAWLDRSAWGEVKDANDLALATYWYTESDEVEGRLYETSEGRQVLLAEELDVPRSAAHLLGGDVVSLIGPERAIELRRRWPGDRDLLLRNFTLGAHRLWMSSQDRREELLEAFTRGVREV